MKTIPMLFALIALGNGNCLAQSGSWAATQSIRNSSHVLLQENKTKGEYLVNSLEVEDNADLTKAKIGYEFTVDQVQGEIKKFYNFTETLIGKLIDAGGNKNTFEDEEDYKNGIPIGLQDKTPANLWMIDNGTALELEQAIKETRQNLVNIYKKMLEFKGEGSFKMSTELIELEQKNIESSLLLVFSEDWKNAGASSWAAYYFKDKTLAEAVAFIASLQLDAVMTQIAISKRIERLLSNVQPAPELTDPLAPIVKTTKSQLRYGEALEADISIHKTLSPSDVVILVKNPRKKTETIKLNSEGKAKYFYTSKETGKQELEFVLEVMNPLTGAKMSASTMVSFEVIK